MMLRGKAPSLGMVNSHRTGVGRGACGDGGDACVAVGVEAGQQARRRERAAAHGTREVGLNRLGLGCHCFVIMWKNARCHPCQDGFELSLLTT